jgi:hypothetical protein
MTKQLSVITGVFLLLGLHASAQAAATPATPVASQPAASSMFLALGGGYNHYSNPATSESTLNLGVQIGNSAFWSISTIAAQAKSATVRSGFGYAIKQSGPVLLLLLADGGATTATSPTPAASSFALGNVGGGMLVRYDLGSLTPKLKNIGLSGGVRMAAIAGTSVQPEWLCGISYVLK